MDISTPQAELSTRAFSREYIRVFFRDYILMGQTLGAYVRSLVTPWNGLATVILGIGAGVAVVRFTQGLAATTNLTDTNPWGLWIGADVLCGVALAAGGYTLAASFYIFGLKEYHPLVRPAVLTGLLGYTFVAVGLLMDLGRPWRLPYPIFVSFGLTSVMLEVGWCVALYLSVQVVEFSPVVFEWLGLRGLRRWAVRLSVGATMAAVMLSTLHQSALGALFLIAPGKLHPLWYSPLLPLFFFVSSIAAGISMVIVESTLSHWAFKKQVGHVNMDRLILGLAKAGAVVLFGYFWLKIVGLAAENAWTYLATGPGAWFMVELLLFILLPSYLFLLASRERSVRLARLTALLTVVGIVVNRLNVSIIAFNWQTETYVPKWTEIAVTIAIITALIVSYRWVVNRMPVLREHPDYVGD